MCFNRVKNRFFPEVVQKWTKKWTNYHFWITFLIKRTVLIGVFAKIGGPNHHFWSHVLDHFIQQEYNVWSKKGSINVVKKGSKHHFWTTFWAVQIWEITNLLNMVWNPALDFGWCQKWSKRGQKGVNTPEKPGFGPSKTVRKWKKSYVPVQMSGSFFFDFSKKNIVSINT